MSWLSSAIDAAGGIFGYEDASGGILEALGLGGTSSSSSSSPSLMNIFGSSGFLEGLGGIGQAIIGNQPAQMDYDLGMAQLGWAQQKWPEQMALEREQMANQLAMAQAAAGATVKAAGIAAGSADRRAKLAAIMDASGRRIDANNFGTTAKLSAIQEMIRAAGRKY